MTDLTFKKFNSKIHDIWEIAELRYNVDYWTYDKIFKNKKEAINALKKYLEVLENLQDFNLIIATDTDKNIIALVEYSIQDYSLILEFIFLFRNLNFSIAFKLAKIMFLDKLVLSDFKKGDLYIGELSVNSKYRNKGYGTLVINKILDYAKNNNYKRVILDADFRNKGALRLYKRIGFKIINKKKSKIFAHKRGMYNLEYLIK